MATPKEKLIALGGTESDALTYEEIMQKVSTVKELELEFGERHFACDVEQFLLPVFSVLYQQDNQVREAVKAELRGFDFSDDTIDRYFTAMGTQPYLSLALDFAYANVSPETKSRFSDAAREAIFRNFKTYLEK